MKKLALYLSLFTVLLIQSCGKEEDYIPDIPFSVNISTNELSNIGDSPGKVVIYARPGVGVAGLVFYNDGGRVLAYDRCSTVNPEQRNAVVFLAGSFVEDKVSGALFDLSNDGSPAKAPAVRALKRYNVDLNGNFITVRN